MSQKGPNWLGWTFASLFGNKNDWHGKPVGKVSIVVVGGVVLVVVLCIFRIYFGLPP